MRLLARKEILKVQLTRVIRYSGTSLALAAAGVLTAGGMASAHDVSPDAFGVVTSIGTDSFTIQTWNNASQTIDTSGSTTYAESGTPNDPTGVTVGENVDVKLDPTASVPTAVSVTVLLDRVSGKVTDVSASSITLDPGWGVPRQVDVSPSTGYFNDGSAVSGVTDGESVTAFGSSTAGAPYAIDASYVDVDGSSPVPPRFGHWATTADWMTASGHSLNSNCHPGTNPVTPPTTSSATARVQPHTVSPPAAPAAPLTTAATAPAGQPGGAFTQGSVPSIRGASGQPGLAGSTSRNFGGSDGGGVQGASGGQSFGSHSSH
jgi:hypothetical protein